MKPSQLDLIPEYVLGTLAEAEHEEIDGLVAASLDLQTEVNQVREALAGLAGTLPPLPPSAGARAHLVKALAGVDRFQPFFAELARRFDLGVDAVRRLLARIDDEAAWEAGPLSSIRLIHFQAGPAVAANDVGLVRLAAGATFPRHRHLGHELTVVLEGCMYDGEHRYLPGQVVEWPGETVHEYGAGPERDLVAVVAHNGIVPAP